MIFSWVLAMRAPPGERSGGGLAPNGGPPGEIPPLAGGPPRIKSGRPPGQGVRKMLGLQRFEWRISPHGLQDTRNGFHMLHGPNYQYLVEAFHVFEL